MMKELESPVERLQVGHTLSLFAIFTP